MRFDLNPNIDPLDSHCQAIRRNLVISSVIGLLISVNENLINYSESSFLGVKFSELTPQYAFWLALICISYHTLYFGWIAYDHSRWQVLKLTGLPIPKPKAGVSVGGHEFDPGVSEQKQATLTSWWRQRTHFRETTEKTLRNVVQDLEAKSSVAEIQPTINSIKNKYEQLSFENDLISESLGRYEREFENYSVRQRIRWFIFDSGIPLLLGIMAIFRIVYLLYSIE
ncbi:hypothetical protein [Vibrio fluvialis]|uniref:hypothetical protein n=1 Tax=Vibrio fluvialis TaxID=676 RepID=UPI0015585E4B|nr:hypothetical protein [Vibrio fluvialis]